MAATCVDQVMLRMISLGVAAPDWCEGCTEAEVAALEDVIQARLPDVYRRYLLRMGHKSGLLFACDHLDAFYDDVLAVARERPADWAEPEHPVPLDFSLPGRALIIASRQRIQFEFIDCARRVDSPAWYFSVGNWKIRRNHTSVCRWLETWCDEAHRVLQTDYFRTSPNGTLTGRHRIAR